MDLFAETNYIKRKQFVALPFCYIRKFLNVIKKFHKHYEHMFNFTKLWILQFIEECYDCPNRRFKWLYD